MKRRIYTPSTLNLFIPKGKGQSVGRWPRMSTLVISLSALVMVAFAAFTPRTVTAADIAFVAGNPEAVETHCSDTLAEPNLFWKGIFFDCSTGSADNSVSADLGQTELRRTYGSNSSVRSATTNPSPDANEGYVGEWRGTIITAQTGAKAAPEVPANSGPMEQHRTYGYD